MHGQFSVPADGPSAGESLPAEGSSARHGSLGERIAALRKHHGLSQVDLGNLIGRSESWVSQVERGARQLDRISVLGKVADALGVSVADLRSADASPGVA